MSPFSLSLFFSDPVNQHQQEKEKKTKTLGTMQHGGGVIESSTRRGQVEEPAAMATAARPGDTHNKCDGKKLLQRHRTWGRTHDLSSVCLQMRRQHRGRRVGHGNSMVW